MERTLLMATIAFAALAIFGSTVSSADEVKSLTVRGETIKVGDTADHVFSIMEKNDMVNQKVSKDPNNPNSLLVIKYYKVKGKSFTIHFARIQDPGPYKIIRILTE